MSEPLVSVVTPVYNGEEYLEACIESVLAQTYENWDYTIVDNCSTDASAEIAARHAAGDSRIRVLTNEQFLGQVDNINQSMAAISDQSKYTKMLLADDWMFPRCIEQMVRVAQENPSVGIVSSYRLEDTCVSCDGLPYPSECVDGRSLCRQSLLDGLFVFGSPSTIMLRSDIVRSRSPFYSTDSPHEDTESCYEVLREHDLGFVHEVLSFTRRQNESETAARFVFDASHLLDKLIIVMKFGPDVLDEDEYAELLRESESRYYRNVADRSLFRTGSEFWDYHRAGLATAGVEFDQGQYRRQLALALLRLLADPVAAIRKIAHVFVRGLNRAFVPSPPPGPTLKSEADASGDPSSNERSEVLR